MTSKLRWSFRVNWVGSDHILVSYKTQENNDWEEFLFTVREYTEWMSLLQEFNSVFREQIDQKLIESYLND
jgi:hypothetical protein